MNDRIKEFAEQVGFGWDDKYHWYVGSRQMEKFAELIVRECLKNMENSDGDLDFAIWQIKRDFGVGGPRGNDEPQENPWKGISIPPPNR